MIKFEKPDYKITEYQENNHYAKFEIEPLERGFGTTIGNAMLVTMDVQQVQVHGLQL